jgi:hypothetical protein
MVEQPPRMVITGKPPRQAPPGRCGCGAKLSIYRPSARTPTGWEEECAPCQRRAVDAAIHHEHARRRYPTRKDATPPRRRRPVTYAQAPVKRQLRLPTKAWQRELQPGLEELGFMFVGEDSDNHAIFQHATAGQVRLAGTPGGHKDEIVRQTFARARRLLTLQQSEAGEFLAHLRDLYGVLPHESKTVRLNLVDEINQWAKRAKPRMQLGTLRSVLRDSPFLEIADPVKGARRQNFIIHGADALNPDTGQLNPGVVVDADIVEQQRQAFLKRVGESGGAIAWLATLLADGAAKAPDVEDAANHAGFSWNAVKNAATELGVIYEREPVYQGRTYWRLPAPPEITELNGAATARTNPSPSAPTPAPPATTPQPGTAPPPQPAPEPPTRPNPEGPKQESPPPSSAPPAAAAAPPPGDLLTQIAGLVDRANRADTAEAKVSIAADELRAVVALCTSLADAAAQLQARCNAALEVIDAA